MRENDSWVTFDSLRYVLFRFIPQTTKFGAGVSIFETITVVVVSKCNVAIKEIMPKAITKIRKNKIKQD